MITPARAPHWDPAVVQLIEQARAEGAAEASEASKIALTSVYIMADRAARKGYDLDPHEVLEAIGEDR